MIFLILLAILGLARPGSIVTDNIGADFNNEGKMTTIYIPFSLQNSISENDFLRIEFPTGFNPNFASSYNPVGFWLSRETSCDFPEFNSKNTVIGSQTGQILILYFQQAGATIGLRAGTNYVLKLIASTPISGTPGYFAPIKMFTTPVSDTSLVDFYTYDRNLFAGAIEIVAQPTIGAMTLNVKTENNNDFGVVSKTHNVTFEITPSITIVSSARLYLKFASEKFKFEANTCILPSSSTGNPLTVSYSTTYLTIQVPESLVAGTKFSFNCSIRNPDTTLTDNLIVRTMYTATETIVEETTLSSAIITVLPLEWEPTSMRVAMGWGFDITDQTLVPKPMKFYRSTTSNPTYNTIWFYFSNVNNTILNALNKAILTTTSDSNFHILTSSITTSLPASSISVPTCTIDSQNTITCANVGVLQCTTCVYYIAFKWSYISTGPELTFPSTFGEISLTSNDDIEIVKASKFTLDSSFTTTVLNPVKFDLLSDFTNANFRGNTAIHSLRITDTLSSSRYGLMAGSDDTQSIIFAHKWATADITSAGTLAAGDGIEYFTSPSVTPSGTISCQGENTVISSVCEMEFASLGFYSNMTRFRFSADPSTASVQFPSSVAITTLNFSSITISKVSSMKIVDDGIYDFYGRGVQGAIVAGPPHIISMTSTSEFLLNAYAVSVTKYSNLNISLSSVWSNSTQGNDGQLFPTIITMAGRFTVDEADTIKTMSIFFSDLTSYTYTGNYSCGFSSDIALNCMFQKAGDHPYHPLYSARLDVDLTPTLDYSVKNDFLFSFPVKTPSNFAGTWLGIAFSRDTAINNDYEPSHLYIYNYLSINTSVVPADLLYTNNSVDFDIPTGVRFGEEDLSGITDIPLNFVLLGQNILNSGASVQLCSKFNAFQASFFRAIFPNSGTGYETICSKYQYVYGTEDRYCAHCPFSDNYDTTTKALKLGGLTFPGIIYTGEDLFAIYSDNTSIAKATKTDNLSTRMKVNFDLELNAFSSNPQQLTFNSGLNRLSITFTPAYAIPPNPILNVIINTDGLFTATLQTLSNQCSLVLRGVEVTCSIAVVSGLWQVTGIPTSYVGVKDEPIQLNLDGIDFTSSSTTAVTGTFSLKILSGSVLVQENWEFQNGTFVIEPSTSPYGAAGEIRFHNISFEFPVKDFHSRLTFNFTVPKSPDLVTSSYFVEMPFPASSINTYSGCEIQDDEGLSSIFISCSFANNTHLELKGKSSAIQKKAYTFNVLVDHVKVPDPSVTLNNISISHVIGTTVLSYTTANVSFNISTSMALQNVTFVKNYNTPGEALEMIFTFPAPFTINYDTRILLHFPFYYPETVAIGNLACLVSSLNRACYTVAERTLVIEGSLLELAQNDTVEVLVYGIIQPITAVQNDITLAVNPGEALMPFNQSVNIPDAAASALPGIFNIINASVETTDVRSLTNYELYFNLTIPGDSDQYVMNILLPHSYQFDLFQGDTSFQCTYNMIKPDQTLLFLPFCERLGSRIKVVIRDIVPNNTIYQLRILNVLNPEYERCDANKITFSVSTPDYQQVFLTSTANSLDMPRYNYSLLGAYRQMRISTFDVFTRVETPIDRSIKLTLTKGTMSRPIKISSIKGQYFLGETVFFVNQLYFTAISGESYTRDVVIQQGFTDTIMILGCDTNTILSEYEVKIWKGELEGRFYDEPPRLIVRVVSAPVIIPVPSKIVIPSGGVSLPISFDLKDYMPYEYISITLTIPPESSTFLALKTSATLRFSREFYKGYLQISASSTVDVGRVLSVSLSIAGRNAASYQLQNPTITVGFTQPPTEDPILKFIQPEQVNSTIQTINALSNQPGAVYYAVLLNQTRNLSCEDVVAGARGQSVYSRYDPTQIQFGQLDITTGNVLVPFTVFKLRASATYLITGCLESQMGVWSPLTKQTFSMADKNASIVAINVTYLAITDTVQEEKFLCFLTRYLEMPKEAIIGEDGVFCKYQDPFYADVTNTLTDPATGPFTYRTYYIYSDRETEEADPRIAVATTDLPKFQDLTSKFRQAYEAFVAKSTGFPGVLKIDILGPIFTNPPRLTGRIEVGTGVSWIGLLGIAVDETGYIAAAIARGRVPTFFEAFHGVENSDINGTTNAVFKVKGSEYVGLNFTGLNSDTDYVIALYTKNLDDTFLTPIPEPLTLYIKTEKEEIITVVSGMKLSLSILCLIVVNFLIF